MPLYMDIHNVDSDTFTVEEVAKAHWEDVSIQEKFGVIQRKYWVNVEAKTIFCLMEGPNKEACNAVHKESHGGTACNIIEVSDDEFNLFLGVGTKNKDDLAQTLKGDVDAGFRTLLMIETYDFKGKYNHYKNQIRLLIQNRNGAILLQPNNDILASFISASEALGCAVAISELLKSIPDDYEYTLALVTGKPVDVDGVKLFEKAKQRVRYLTKIDLDNTIYIDDSTLVLANKEPHTTSINSNEFRIVDEVDFDFLDKLFDILNRELFKPNFKIERLYTSLGLSKSQAYRKIKSLTGMGPNKFIQELRLHQSLKDIGQNNKTVAEIAYDLGYNSPTYFTRVFRRRFGILPTIFAKNATN
ncbi:MAG: nickel-binding protein [Maribacter sp.]